MVVLLVGIMTIVTMFPTGFRVVRAAESQTIATKLAQAEVERWKNMPGNLPDAILPLAFQATWDSNYTIINEQDPGPQFVGMQDAGVAGRYYPGNAGNFRMVLNEVTPIPVASYFQTGGGAMYGSRYNLAFSPIEVNGPDANGQYDGITVKSGDLLRRVGDSDSSMYVRSGQYGIDYNVTNGAFRVCLSYDRNPTHIYYVSYSYSVHNPQTGDTQYLSTVDQEVHPKDDSDPNYNNGWVDVPVSVPTDYVIDGDEIEAGSDTCARGFAQVVYNWDPRDIYEFTIADSILGIVAFNPRAHNALERTARGVRAVTARVSYRIYDTRIIREERVMALPNEDLDEDGSNDHTAVKLALKYVLNSGDPTVIGDGDPTDNPGEPTFEGLVYRHLGVQVGGANDILVPQSLLVIDLSTGLRVEMPTTLPTGMDGSRYPIDYQAGIVHLPDRANLIDWSSSVPKDKTGNPYPECVNVPLRGRHLRFFYRADGDWSMQCQKAYCFFIRDYDVQIDFRRFRLIQDGDGLWKLIFARCMAGQSVAVDYTYSDADGVHKVSGQNLRLSDDPLMLGGINYCYAVLGPPGASIDPRDRIIVVGTSFRSRIVWRDGRTWRHVDIDTSLTRNSAL